jgi:Ca2+-binding EF-hand superfamily protein
MKKIDSSSSGQFNLQQLEDLVRTRGKDPDTLQDVIDALKVFDTDHDGKISTEEFLYAMTNMGERMTDEEVREILADSDLDEGKAIKIEDFARMIMTRI